MISVVMSAFRMDMPAARHEKQIVLTKLSRGKAGHETENFGKQEIVRPLYIPKEGEHFGDSI